MFYDGNPKQEPGAVVCRVAESFTRFGSFQIFSARGEIQVLQQLLDFTIRTDFPHLGEPTKEVYVKWFEEVCRTTAEMIVHWMRVGFVHGVMNTDNMSILGLTIDYGPYGWLEDYDPNWTPNTTDAAGRRYCFGNQPQIALWNLAQLGNAMLPLVDSPEPLEQGLELYSECFQTGWQSMMVQKLGLKVFQPETDTTLVNDLLAILQMVETDMTVFYRKLAMVDVNHQFSEDFSEATWMTTLADAYYQPDQLTPEYRARMSQWFQVYGRRLHAQGISESARQKSMNAANPKYVLRNYLAQLAIDKAEQGELSTVTELLDVLRYPYEEQPGKEVYAEKRPDWARNRAGCSMLSCSS